MTLTGLASLTQPAAASDVKAAGDEAAGRARSLIVGLQQHKRP